MYIICCFKDLWKIWFVSLVVYFLLLHMQTIVFWLNCFHKVTEILSPAKMLKYHEVVFWMSVHLKIINLRFCDLLHDSAL